MIGIIDYGMGNLRSVKKALEYLHFEAAILDDPDEIGTCEKVILPGVGAFEQAVERLRATGMDRAVLRAADAGKPVLGICLGMQMMYEASEENGMHRGLGLFPGCIRRLKGGKGIKIPHMGWNTITPRESMLFANADPVEVYFVHSYCAPGTSEFTIASCEHGEVFTAACQRESVCAAQFHPEKSGEAGLGMLKRFASGEGWKTC